MLSGKSKRESWHSLHSATAPRLRRLGWTADQSHLRFVLSGPSDPALRVALLDEGKVVRAASPSGATAVVDWDTSELIGRSVVLLVEDQSPIGGLAFDEVVTW